ncbi:MAG: multiheme c-type cytochrome [Candidatus Zixiibacteriota bacterium]
MRTKLIWLTGLLLAALLMQFGCERKTVTTTEVIKEVSPQDAAYVGSAECGTSGCHEGVLATFRNTGHPYKLNDADSARLPVGQYYPFTSVPNPSDVSWDNISMVIGGFWWKARYIDNEGYILTGANRQYNFETQQFVSYDAATAPRKPYDCGPCHMTNYVDTGHQGGLPGLVGTWTFNGVQCEECHGPGEFHAAEPYKFAMEIDRSSEACGKCHIRGSVQKIPAKSGWVEHHEQWNEMFRTKHAALECVDCHNPHIGLHADNPERESAIKVACESCHLAETQGFLASGIGHAASEAGPDCIDCHMAKTGKSAVANATTFTGDVRSHSWTINMDPNAAMFTQDGLFANGYITLDFACLQCHTSETKEWAATYAPLVHTPIGSPSSGDFSQLASSTLKGH